MSNITQRHDSSLYSREEGAIRVAESWSLTFREYNTVMKVEGGYIATNKFDPRCNDKITPIAPRYSCNDAGRSN